ncbi:MAG: FmdB family zinc ribbon protein [Mycobacterium sp.]
MPTYSYACTECGNHFDVTQAFTDDALTTCEQCSGRLRKIFSSVGVVFKGSGFYRTDSRESAKSSVNGSGNGPTKPGTSSESGSGGGDTGSGDSGSGSGSGDKSTASGDKKPAEKKSADKAPASTGSTTTATTST